MSYCIIFKMNIDKLLGYSVSQKIFPSALKEPVLEGYIYGQFEARLNPFFRAL